MLKLLSAKEREGKICAVCGEIHSVKYKVDIYGDNDEVINQVLMCNRCVLELQLNKPKVPMTEVKEG